MNNISITIFELQEIYDLMNDLKEARDKTGRLRAGITATVYDCNSNRLGTISENYREEFMFTVGD